MKVEFCVNFTVFNEFSWYGGFIPRSKELEAW